MRKSPALLACVILAACQSPDIATTSQSGGMSGADGSAPLTATDAAAATTAGGMSTSSAPLPTTEPSAPGGSTSTTITTTTTLSSDPVATTDSTDSTATSSTSSTTGTTGAPPEPPWTPKGCPALYAQDLLPTFELEISDKELSKLKNEWELGDEDNLAEHPLLAFKYQDHIVTTATVSLRGNSKWWPQMGKKMQLEVAFNTVDPKGRFMGLRKLLFDAARYNESFLRDRLALAILNDVGLPAPCANNARVVLNGEYFGLFTSIEKVDKEVLERRFEDPEGNLYKRQGWAKKTNDADMDVSDIEALLAAKTLGDLEKLMHLDEALLEWAAEAVIPNGDGTWAGGLNGYYYNDPKTGFNVIPWDLDATFTRLPETTDPYLYLKPDDWGRPFYDITTADPVWFDNYIEKLAYVLEHGYNVDVLQARMDAWAAQIADAAAEDPNKPFSLADHLLAVQEQRDYVAKRAEYLKSWLACWQNGGTKTKAGKCKPA